MYKLAITSIPCTCSILVYFWARKVLMSSDLPQYKASLVQGYYGIMVQYHAMQWILHNFILQILNHKRNLVGNISVLDGLCRSLTTLSRVHWVIHTINEHICTYVRHDNVYCECRISSHYGLWVWIVPYYVYYIQRGTGLSAGFSGISATEYAVLYSSSSSES